MRKFKDLRESDDALAAAASGNDHLREQTHEQKRRCAELNDVDLEMAKSSHNQRLSRMKETHESNMTACSQQIQDLEQKFKDLHEEAGSLRAQHDSLLGHIAELRNEIADRKAACAKGSEERRIIENELAAARQEHHKERLKLQSAIDQLTPHSTATEKEINDITEQLTSQKRVVMAQDTEAASRIGALEELLKSTQAQLAEAKNRLVEATENLDRTHRDTGTHHQRQTESQVATQKDIAFKRQEASEEIRVLEEQVANERREVHENKEHLERWRSGHHASLRQHKDEGESKIALLEREKARMEESYRVDLTQTQKAILQQQQHLDMLEKDLGRVRHLLQESQSNLAWIRQEKEREEQESAAVRVHLDDEVKILSTSVHAAASTEATLGSHAGAAKTLKDKEHYQIRQEVADLRQACVTQKADAESKMKRLQDEFDARQQLLEQRQRETVAKTKSRTESLLQENNKLQHFIEEHRQAHSGLSSQRRDIEGHIQQLRAHTNDLNQRQPSAHAGA